VTPFLLREARPADQESIRAIVGEVLREYGLEVDPKETDADLADVQASYVGRGGVFLVLTGSDGSIAGCGGLYPVSATEAEIRKMYFLPDARGKGYGRRLLTLLIGAARDRGYRRVVLETAAVLKEAIALYRSAGFKPYARERIACRCDQAMALELS
jgi:putative acetyltransferase